MERDNQALERELEYNDVIDPYKDQAVKNVINAFNEGYMLGRKHGEAVFGGENGGR